MKNNRYSNLKITQFPNKLESFRRGVITAPLYVRIKPINLCNHHCFWCVYHAPDKSQMHTEMNDVDKIPRAKLLEIIQDLHHLGVRAVTFSGGGEPLMHEAICDTMRSVLDKGLDLSIITNGHLLEKERAELLGQAKWVRVSMDYSSAKDLKRFRGVDETGYRRIMNNIRLFALSKNKDTDLAVNYIVHRDNCENLYSIAFELRELGVENVRFSPMWISPGFHEYHAPLVPHVTKQLDMIQGMCGPLFSVNSTYDLSGSGFSPVRSYCKCLVMQTVPVIGADLNVYACHNKAYDKKGLIGSIANRRFHELWYSDEAKAVFNGLNPQTDCLHQCANDNKNHVMHDLTDMHIDNFV